MAHVLKPPPAEKIGSVAGGSSRGTPPNDTPAQETELQAFVREHELAPYLEIAERLIAKHFSTSPVRIEKEDDPEFPDEWVCLHVRVSGEVDSIVEAYTAYGKEFCASIPSKVIGKIRLSLDTV